MIKIHMDPGRLSIEELQNISRALRSSCMDCVERSVPDCCRHSAEVRHFLNAMADAVDGVRVRREQRDNELALGVDSDSGEWVAGA